MNYMDNPLVKAQIGLTKLEFGLGMPYDGHRGDGTVMSYRAMVDKLNAVARAMRDIGSDDISELVERYYAVKAYGTAMFAGVVKTLKVKPAFA